MPTRGAPAGVARAGTGQARGQIWAGWDVAETRARASEWVIAALTVGRTRRLTDLGLTDVTVVGHDWGAVFAYVYAASCTQRGRDPQSLTALNCVSSCP